MIPRRPGLIVMLATLLACGGGRSSPGSALPPDTLDHDASAPFAGTWIGTATLELSGTPHTSRTTTVISVTDRNTLYLPNFCSDGSGPSARVTADAAFTFGHYACPVSGSDCSATWDISGGSGTLSSGTLDFTANGALNGCGYSSAAMEITFSGTQGGPTSPSISSLDPPSQPQGSASFTLTVSGSGFPPASLVEWNGSTRATTYVSESELTATILASDLATAGTAYVAVLDPSSGAASGAVPFDVTASQAIAALYPSSLPSGSADFNLFVNGSGFTPSSVVSWNGSPRATTYGSSWNLSATIPAGDLACPGFASVTVSDPGSGQTSAPATFTIGEGQAADLLNLGANDLVWDPAHQQLYLSLPNTAPANPNTIAVVDPAGGSVAAAYFAGSQPDRLAISDDGRYLYAGLDGGAAVRRFSLPSFAKDIDLSLGSDPTYGAYVARDLAVAPATPGTVAVSLGATAYYVSVGGLVVYDDATPRPTAAPGYYGTGGGSFDSIQWGSDATVLYGENNSYGMGDFYRLSVTSAGVMLDHDYQGVFRGYGGRIHFDPVTGLVYADDGQAIDPATGLPVGTYGLSAPMAVDSALNEAFFVIQDFATSAMVVKSFDLTHFTPIGSSTIANLPWSGASVRRVVRFGATGLAFLMSDGRLALVQIPGTTSPACH
jgi:hypothetical protein